MMTTFMVGFLCGALVYWNVSKHLERARRARRDFRYTVRQVRGATEAMVHGAMRAVGWGLGGVMVLVVVVAVWREAL